MTIEVQESPVVCTQRIAEAIRGKGYGIATNYAYCHTENLPNNTDFMVVDTNRAVRGRFFGGIKACCKIANISSTDEGSKVEVFGRKYWDIIKESLGKVSEDLSSPLKVILAGENPAWIWPSQD